MEINNILSVLIIATAIITFIIGLQDANEDDKLKKKLKWSKLVFLAIIMLLSILTLLYQNKKEELKNKDDAANLRATQKRIDTTIAKQDRSIKSLDSIIKATQKVANVQIDEISSLNHIYNIVNSSTDLSITATIKIFEDSLIKSLDGREEIVNKNEVYYQKKEELNHSYDEFETKSVFYHHQSNYYLQQKFNCRLNLTIMPSGTKFKSIVENGRSMPTKSESIFLTSQTSGVKTSYELIEVENTSSDWKFDAFELKMKYCGDAKMFPDTLFVNYNQFANRYVSVELQSNIDSLKLENVFIKNNLNKFSYKIRILKTLGKVRHDNYYTVMSGVDDFYTLTYNYLGKVEELINK